MTRTGGLSSLGHEGSWMSQVISLSLPSGPPHTVVSGLLTARIVLPGRAGAWGSGGSLRINGSPPNSETREGESMSLRVAASPAEGTVSV